MPYTQLKKPASKPRAENRAGAAKGVMTSKLPSGALTSDTTALGGSACNTCLGIVKLPAEPLALHTNLARALAFGSPARPSDR